MSDSSHAPARLTVPTAGDRLPASAADATAVLERAQAIAAGLEHREATLVGQRVGLVSHDPEDVLLARVLKAYGAHVTFLSPVAVSGLTDYQSGAVQRLADVLRQQTVGLDLDAFAAGEGPGVPTEVLRLDDLSGRSGSPFDLVLALGMLPAGETAATQALRQLSGLARVGGVIEVFDDCRAPLSEEVARRLAAQVGHLCWV